jgi:hypothetical protein
MQYAVLANPMVYAGELRGALVPTVPHIPLAATFAALGAMDLLFVTIGLKKFHGKAIS